MFSKLFFKCVMHFSTLKIPFKILRGLDWGYSYKMSAPLWLGGIWQSGIVKQSWCKDILVMRMSEFYKSHCDEALKHYVILSNWGGSSQRTSIPNQAKITCNSAAIYGLFPHVITRLQLASCFCWLGSLKLIYAWCSWCLGIPGDCRGATSGWHLCCLCWFFSRWTVKYKTYLKL